MTTEALHLEGRTSAAYWRRSRPRTTSEPSSDSSDNRGELAQLPTYYYKKELLQALTDHRVVICQGETGSGKSTQFPQYLCDGFNPAGIIGVTQPRRVAAISVATRVAEERNCRLGEEVGFQIRFKDHTSSGTRIKFLTDGCLVRECLDDPTLRRYSIIMLDEAHERSLQTDILFGLMKRALGIRPDLKVLVTSATLDVARFSRYFGNCPVKQIPVRNHPVSVFHSKSKFIMTRAGPSSSSYVKSLVDVVLKIHRTQGEGHILAFLTGQHEIEKACASIRNAVAEEPCRGQVEFGMMLQVMPLYAVMAPEQQAQIFRPDKIGVRKCIVATNIAETSLTVPGVRYVIDPGFVKQKTYNPQKRMESLVVVPISQVAAEQRAGRAGRTGPGQCYRLYSKECLTEMMPETVPEIQRCNLSTVVLYLKLIGINNVVDFDYFERPSQEQLSEALLLLHALEALDEDGKVTEIGEQMSRFPLDPSLSRAIIQAEKEGCMKEVITISAMLSVESIWFSRQLDDRSKDDQADRAHAIFRHPRGDHISFLMIYAAWEERGFSETWCKDAFLSVRALKEAKNVRSQLESEVCRASIGNLHSSARGVEPICRAITAGYFSNAASRCGTDSTIYKHMQGLMPNEDLKLVHLHPTSVLVTGIKPPQYIIYHELTYTSRPFIRHVVGVRREWLTHCRSRVGTTNVSRLSEGRLGETSVEEQPAEVSSACAPMDLVKASTNAESMAKETAVAAARQRFLARKEELAASSKRKREP